MEEYIDWSTWEKRGDKLMEQGKYEDAAKAYEKGILDYPCKANLFFKCGHAYLEAKCYDDAYYFLNTAIALNPKKAKAFYYRHAANAGMGFIDCFDIDKAIALDPEDPAIVHDRGWTYAYLDRHEEAVKDFSKCIEIDPGSAYSYYICRAKSYRKLNHLDMAMDDLSNAIEINPSYEEPYLWRANIKYEINNYDAALTDLEMAVKLNPLCDLAYLGIGRIWEKLGDGEKALTSYSTAIEINPKNHHAHCGRGYIYYCQKKYKEAIVELNKAAALYSDSDYLFYRGRCYEKLGDEEKALTSYSAAIEINPNNGRAYFGRGYTYYCQKQYKEAIEEINKAVKLHDNSDYFFYRGRCYEALGDSGNATKDYQIASNMGNLDAQKILEAKGFTLENMK